MGEWWKAAGICLFLLLELAGCTWADTQFLRPIAPALLLEPGHTVGQTFVARHGGLNGLELWLEPERGAKGILRLHLRADPRSPIDLAVVELLLEAVTVPRFYRFSFPPDNRSHGMYRYAFLELEGKGAVRVGAAPGDAYIDGAAYRDHEPLDVQLAFRLTYDLKGIAIELAQAVLAGVGFLSLSALIYLIPGYVLLAWFWTGGSLSWPDRIGLAVGISLALYPLLLLWTDFVGVRGGALYAWLPAGGGLVALAYRHRRWRMRQGWAALQRWWREEASGPDGMLIGILLLALGVRLLVARGLEAPMWGDGLQHTMIVQLLLDHGGLFREWAPYAPIISFTYHYGFHSQMAALAWISGWSALQAVLFGGQLMNGLAAFTLYPLARRMGGSPWAGVVAVALPALWWSMPMSYTNWGRYPQLAGQTLLPVAVLLTVESLESQKPNLRLLLLTAWVVAGLGLTHYRVLAFYGIFLIAWMLVHGRWLLDPAWKERVLRLLILGGLVVILIIPWLGRLGEGGLPAFLQQTLSAGGGSSPGLETWGDLKMYMPLWGWILGGLALIAGWMRHRNKIGFLLIWWAGAFLSANPQLVGLPGSGVISSFAFWIGIYFPMALLIGIAIGDLLEIGWRNPWVRRMGIVLIGLFGAWGAWNRLGDIDPGSHAMLTRPDRQAMDWIRIHLPSDARFLINGFLAYGGQDAVGSDGGWWLPMLAQRAVLIPPLPYAIERTTDPHLPSRLREWISRLTARDPQILNDLVRLGWCYVYVGQQQGRVNAPQPPLWMPDELRGGPWELLYHQDRVWIFRWRDCEYPGRE